MGWVLSAFALGYALMQTPGGVLADKFGARKIMTAIMVLWSLFTGLTAKAWNYISLLIIRFLFGAGEAGAFPAINRAVFSWIPVKERGIVTGINFSGSRLGAAFALPMLSALMVSIGWKNTFMLLAAIGMVLACIWYLAFRDKPEEHPLLSADEKAFIAEQRQAVSNSAKAVPLGVMLQQRNMRLAMLQYFCSNFTFFFALTWLYPHIREKFALDAVTAGWYASLPLVFGAVGNWLGGLWMDRIYAKGKLNASRRMPAAIGFLLSAIGLIGCAWSGNVVSAVAFLCIAIMGADMTLPPSWAFCSDIGRQQSGAVSGNMNMAGNVGSFITSLAFPYLLLWVGNSAVFFYVAAVLNIVAVLCWLGMKPDRVIAS